MDKAIVQALHGLIPSLTGPLPPELIALSSSLLAQSRSQASSLKADEEIARTYACANIACERLKKSLSLPRIEPRPPCPPRIYQKLYTYLDDVIPASPKKAPKTSDHVGQKKGPMEGTPSKSGVRNASTPTRSGTSRHVATRTKPVSASGAEPPDWTMPVIRRLCKALEAPAAPAHIYTGVESIIRSLSDENSSQEAAEDIKLAGLIVALAFFVSSRLAGVELKSEELVQKMKASLAIMDEIRSEGVEIGDLTEVDVRAHMRMVAARKWIQMDWFRNIKVGAGLGICDTQKERSGGEGSDPEAEEEEPFMPAARKKRENADGPKAVDYLRPGLGTMMQSKVDYLSDESLMEYKEWETGIWRRIREMERADASRMESEEG